MPRLVLPRLTPGTGGCWLWTGSRDPYGYGRRSERGDGLSSLVHRALWTTYRADPDPAQVIDKPAALAAEPALVKRLQRMRRSRLTRRVA